MSLTGRRERAIEIPAGVNEHTFITVYCIPGFNCFCLFGGLLNSTFLRDGDFQKKQFSFSAGQELYGKVPRSLWLMQALTP